MAVGVLVGVWVGVGVTVGVLVGVWVAVGRGRGVVIGKVIFTFWSSSSSCLSPPLYVRYSVAVTSTVVPEVHP